MWTTVLNENKSPLVYFNPYTYELKKTQIINFFDFFKHSHITVPKDSRAFYDNKAIIYVNDPLFNKAFCKIYLPSLQRQGCTLTKNIHFFDCVLNQQSRLANFFEKYLFIEGVSEDLGFHQFSVQSQTKNVLEVENKIPSTRSWKSFAQRATHIFSFVICPLLPIIALIGKIIYRNHQLFVSKS